MNAGILFLVIFSLISLSGSLTAQNDLSLKTFEKDLFKTEKGDLAITMIGHGTLMVEADGKVIHIDPVSREADYTKLPKADLILITHEHGDHLDKNAIAILKKENSSLVLSKSCEGKIDGGKVMLNGESQTLGNLLIEAVPAYNIIHQRSEGNPYHPKGNGNGYILNYGGKRVYIAGDTENIPEMSGLKNIDIAFLPMNLPYTMTPGMVVKAWKSFRPAILYPYHFGDTDTNKLVELLKDEAVEVRIRKLK